MVKRNFRIIRCVCGLLFLLFCFLFLYSLQPDWMALTQRILSKGQTTYAPLLGAVLITFVLQLVQVGMERWVSWPLRLYAFSYAPSCLLLALCTGYSFEALGDRSEALSLWGIGALVLLYAGGVRLVRSWPSATGEPSSFFTALWPNALMLSVMLFWVGLAGNTNDSLHQELRMVRWVEEGNYEAALQVGRRSDVTTPSLSALRAYTLSECGLLGDKLFFYPHPEGLQGLLPQAQDSLLTERWAYKLYRKLGGRPGSSVVRRPLRYLELLAERDTVAQAVVDYLLCGYLLDKRLDRFAEALPAYYAVNDSLPLHYKEALVLYAHVRTHPVLVFSEGAIVANYDGFQDCRARCKPHSVEQYSRCRDMYGHTYWFYYYFHDGPAEHAIGK